MKALWPFLAAGSLCGATLVMKWDANTEEDLSHYTVYSGTNSGIYNSKTNTTGTNITLDTASTFFAVTATSTANLESELSSEVVVTNTPPLALSRLRIITYVQTILEGDNSWRISTSFVSQAAMKAGVPYRSETYAELHKPDQLRLSVFIQELTLGSWINATNYLYTALMSSNTSYRTLSFTEITP